MSKLLLLPPCDDPSWIPRIVEVCDLEPILCSDLLTALEHAPDALAAFGTLPGEVLERADHLRWLQAPQAGPQAGWYTPELVAHPVIVTNFRGIFNEHLSAHIMSFVLAFARGLPVYGQQQARHEWRPGAPLVHLPDSTALVIGVGGIGAATARMLSEFGVRVLAVDPRVAEAPVGVRQLHPPEALDSLLPSADFVICTAPETPATQGLFDRARLRRMRRSAYLINISRGALVRLDDLVAALQAGEIAGAGLDVFEQEPLPPEHPLWGLPQVILTPHVGGEGPHLEERRAAVFLENCRRFRSNEPLLNVVDKANWF